MSAELHRSPLLLSADDSALVVIDAQEKLLRAIHQADRVVWNLQRLVDGAAVLQVPWLATEQYPEGLGPTVGPLRASLTNHPESGGIPTKLTFSCGGCEQFVTRLGELGRRQLVLGGVETHVCVLQTALDLLSDDYDVYLCVDALGTRFELDHQTALRRMEACGATLTTTEAVLFEWCQRAGTAEFKRISQIVRQTPPGA